MPCAGPAAAIHLVEGGPADGQPGVGQPLQLGDRQLRLGGELLVVGMRRCGGGQVRPPLRQYTSKSAQAAAGGDVGGEHGGHAVLHLPGAPGVLGSDARRGVPSEVAVSSIAIPGPIRSSSRPAATQRRARQLARRSFQSHTYDLSRACIRPHPRARPPPRDSSSSLASPVSAVMYAKQNRAAPLRQHAAQNSPDLRIHPRDAPGHPLCWPSGRGIFLFVTNQDASRPPDYTDVRRRPGTASRSSSLTVTSVAGQSGSNRVHMSTHRVSGGHQKETARNRGRTDDPRVGFALPFPGQSHSLLGRVALSARGDPCSRQSSPPFHPQPSTPILRVRHWCGARRHLASALAAAAHHCAGRPLSCCQ